MTLPQLGSLVSLPAPDHPELVAPPVAAALATWADADAGRGRRDRPGARRHRRDDRALRALAARQPQLRRRGGGARAGDERIAACLVRADTRADVNKRVERLLDVRKASFLPMDRAVRSPGWSTAGSPRSACRRRGGCCVDARVLEIDVAMVGSGMRRSKLLLPGGLLAELPGAEVVEDLAG